MTGLGNWIGTLTGFNMGSNNIEIDQAPGIYEEIRISNITRSADWIKAQYLSMNGSFIDFGQEESLEDPNTGAAYVFYGYEGMDLSNIDAINANITIAGDKSGDLFGWDVAGIGDFNGDGYDDIIVGAPGTDLNGTDSGTAYVFLGRPSGSWPSSMDSSDANLTINISSAGDKAGFSVASLGDVNNDGFSDIGIGGPFNDTTDGSISNAGCVWVFLGYSGSSFLDDANVTIDGNQIDAQLGFSLSGAGDVNDDDYDDLIVGAPFNNTGGSPNAGAAHVFYGSNSLISSLGPSTANVNLSGVAAQDLFGWSVNGTGDLNNDDHDDIVVGAPGYSSDKGRCYIYQGSATMDNTADIVLTGSASGDKFGFSVCGGLDIDNDGTPDVAVDAPFVDNNSLPDCGAVYIFYGEGLGDTTADNANHTNYGNQSGSHFGWSVSFAGDVNGDGYDDLLVGSPHYDDVIPEPDHIDVGKAYIFTFNGVDVPEFPLLMVPASILMISCFNIILKRKRKYQLNKGGK